MNMKKKFFKVAFIAAVTVVSGISVFNAQKTETLSDIALANVEALAGYEEGTKVGTCYIEMNFSTVVGHRIFCDSRTDNNTIYPCPSSTSYGGYNEMQIDRCTK